MIGVRCLPSIQDSASLPCPYEKLIACSELPYKPYVYLPIFPGIAATVTYEVGVVYYTCRNEVGQHPQCHLTRIVLGVEQTRCVGHHP